VCIAWLSSKERFVVILTLNTFGAHVLMDRCLQEEERKGGKKGRLLGIITLSDVLRYVVGPVGIQESVEPPEEPLNGPTPTEREISIS
jgi:CBS domain-containing protein